MHNCKTIRSQLVELLSAGDNALPEELSLELRECATCEREFQTLSNTMRLATRGLNAAMPADSYWPVYHARLEEKLLGIGVAAEARSNDVQGVGAVIKRLFSSSLTIRTPVAAALLFVFALSLAALAWTSRGSEQTIISQEPAVVHVPVEVPVVQEKIVTKVVYVPRKPASKNRQTLNRRAPANDENTFSRLGFKPTNDVKLTVIKGETRDEN